MGHPTKLWQRWSRWSTPTERRKGRCAWTRSASWRQGRNSSGADSPSCVRSVRNINSCSATLRHKQQCASVSLYTGEHSRFKFFREEALVQLEEAAVAEEPLGGRLQASR